MKGESGNSYKFKVEARPPLHKRRQSSCSGTSDTETISQKQMDENTNLQESMTFSKLEFKHEDSRETKQLKELLLLHLDLITQQQEILQAKERQVRNLKSEKETLKCRLERMERRMSLLRQNKRGADPISLNTAQLIQSAPPANRLPDENITSSRPLKRKGSLEPQSLSKRFAGGASVGSSNKVSSLCEQEKVSNNGHQSSSGHHTPRRSCKGSQTLRHNSSQFGYRQFSRTPHRHTGESSVGNDSDSTIKTLSPPRNQYKKVEESSPEPDVLETIKQNLHPVCLLLDQDKEYFHRTDCNYYVPWEIPLCPYEKISPKKKNENLLVPNYRVRLIPTGYSMEGTENLDDEIFSKRHNKPELEEKRRKRWDMQRMREQRLYEKLQGKNTKNMSLIESQVPPESFLPDPDEVRYIEICDHVPVSAFGYPVPHIKTSDFELPEFDLDRREKEENRKGTNRKKR